jgi:hypothetical protein
MNGEYNTPEIENSETTDLQDTSKFEQILNDVTIAKKHIH